MSYLLDALKKSEMERQQGSVPDLHFQQQVYPDKVQAPRSHRRIYRYLAICCLLAGLCFLLWYFHQPLLQMVTTQDISHEQQRSPDTEFRMSQQLPKQSVPLKSPSASDRKETTSGSEWQEKNQLTVDDTTPSSSPPNSPVSNEQGQTVVAEHGDVSPSPAIVIQPAPLVVAEVAAAQSDNEISTNVLDLETLPLTIRKSIPALQFAAHTYSETPSKRMIIINNEIFKEGDTVANGIILKEITWQSVILEKAGILFQIHVAP